MAFFVVGNVVVPVPFPQKVMNKSAKTSNEEREFSRKKSSRFFSFD
jgi:tryptophan synthase beta subunit